jgi:hypothetical protein
VFGSALLASSKRRIASRKAGSSLPVALIGRMTGNKWKIANG